MRGPGPPPPQRVDLTFHLVTVRTAPDRPTHADVVATRLWAFGAVGVEQRTDRLVGAFADTTRALAVVEALGGSVEAVADDAGLDARRDPAPIVRAGPFVIHPPWVATPRGEIVLSIDAGKAFGSGSHASTRLALRALADVVGPGDRVLDVGSGSGILSVAAAMRDATVTAVDVDPAALEATRRNADANRVAGRVTVIAGDAGDHRVAEGVDVVVVNMTIDRHEAMAYGLRTTAGSAGTVIVSGVLAGDQEARAAAAYGRTTVGRFAEAEWVALLLR